MSEHVVELLQIPARAFGFDGSLEGSVGLIALLATALALLALAVFLNQRTPSAFPAAVVGDAAPSAPWSEAHDSTVACEVDSTASEAAAAVLAVRTPGGGE